MNHSQKTIRNAAIIIIISLVASILLHYTLAQRQDEDRIQLDEIIDYHTAMGRNITTDGEHITVINKP